MLEIAAQDRVERFTEKPNSDGWMSAGFFVLNRAVFDYLGADDCVFERGPLVWNNWRPNGQLMAYRHNGFFYAMDTYREYRRLNDLWTSGAAPWRVW